MGTKTYIIAELSANHNGNKKNAVDTIYAAKRAGADAIKLQTYTADTITLESDKKDFIIQDTIWQGQRFYDLYNKAHTPWNWHEDLMNIANEIGLDCFSSPFDKTAVDFLESLNVPKYKIASFEITDIPLIKYVASKGKPIIISTGIATYDDIKLAVDTCRVEGNSDITILKCTSSYPAPLEEANLVMMQQFAEDFDVKVGLSDHTLGTRVPVVATALGASVIEKHFILDKSIGGPDSSFSLDEKEFTKMVRAVRETESAMGKVSYELTEKQKTGKQFSRSLYIAEDVKKGDIITELNVRSVRPGYGLHPKHLDVIIGKEFKADFTKGTRLSFDQFQ